MTYDQSLLNCPELPLMILLSEEMININEPSLSNSAMTKYKTFNGEEIDGRKVWHYDYHDDDA